MTDCKTDRRSLLRLGAALLVGGGISGCASINRDDKSRVRGRTATDNENAVIWKLGAGKPYADGAALTPGVCSLPGPNRKVRFPDPDKYKDTERIPGMCQLCSTVCGTLAHVKDGRVIKIDGNPKDPNSKGKLCARGQAGLNHQYHPERLLYPLKRVGERGEGKWKRISWDEAYDELASRLTECRKTDPTEFAFHQGRSRSKDPVSAFLNAFGTATQLNHRGLCSASRRAANLTYLFESDWDLGDYANSKYILNFGSNMFEAHQGHVAGAQRLQSGRFENGAKLVTFDVRMSNTAGNSDEFYMPRPGTDGAVALALGHVIVRDGLADEDWFRTWANASLEDVWEHVLKDATPEWAEKMSTVPAEAIERIAREFAAAAPRATTMCNRGSSAHVNGFYNDRCIILLNGLVGSVGKPGGWCWMWTGGMDKKRFALPPQPAKTKAKSLLADPPEFVLANSWNTMRVGEIVYWYLKQERAKIQVYMTYNLDSPMTWPEMDVTRSVLKDESKIGFHVCINPFYNETAHFADMVLPWTTYLERWELDARGAYNLKPYVNVRWPVAAPLGEAKDLREMLPELARRMGGDMAEQWFATHTQEEYMAEWTKDIPFDESKYSSALEHLRVEGAYEDPEESQYFEPHMRPLSEEELAGSVADKESGILTKDGKGIGILVNGKALRGFKTPSRKFEVYSEFLVKTAKNEDTSHLTDKANSKGRNRAAHHKGHEYELSPWPKFEVPEEHKHLDEDQLVMTSFKWGVHNHGRTANLKWCSEIVHSNPAWLHPTTAERFGLKNGDWIELTGYRSTTVDQIMPSLGLGDGPIKSKLQLPIVVTKGVHPDAIAISASLGHDQYSSVAQARRNGALGDHGKGMNPAGLRDEDWERNMWWQDNSDGDHSKWKRNTGNGWAQNHVMPISPDYISGQQAFNSTVVRIKKLS
ncbi:MAG: thiosulfate reductase/polysulfide reductase chain A [Planctomycetota bacterium]|jgi:thiosulfate reductase/polysulfide reductase chain A